MQVLPQCGHAVHEDVPDKVRHFVCYMQVNKPHFLNLWALCNRKCKKQTVSRMKKEISEVCVENVNLSEYGMIYSDFEIDQTR